MSLLILGVVGALAGALGPGPLSKVEQPLGGGAITLRYDRFARFGAPGQVALKVKQRLPSRYLLVHVDRSLSEAEGVQSTAPQALLTQADPDGLVYTFDLGQQQQGSVTIKTQPTRRGLVRGTLSVGGEPLAVSQFVWP